LSHAAPGYSSSAAPQFAPALLTSTCTVSSRSPTASASPTHPASDDRSAGTATHSPAPTADSSVAARSHASAFRELTYTRAPPSTSPRAIINPIPRLPPVTTAVFPATENRSSMLAPPDLRFRRPHMIGR
jgi:hypothetical protein